MRSASSSTTREPARRAADTTPVSRVRGSGWGRHPDDVVDTLRRREWDDPVRLKQRLLGERAFPIRVSLGPPTGDRALDDLAQFGRWLQAWRAFAPAERVVWEARRLRRLGEQRLPIALEITSMQELASVLGTSAVMRMQAWEPQLEPLLNLARPDRRPVLYQALVRGLERIEQLDPEEVSRLVRLVPQLVFGMGAGAYLRALPLVGIDTKFVETHERLLTDMLDALHDGGIGEAGGLRAWLGSLDSPGGWITIRPLCEGARIALGDLPILQLPMQHLAERALPARRILVVENLASGLALPSMSDTIAVIGTGRNLAWLAAPWLADRQVGYWGDIDSWGLQMLGEARGHCTHLHALLMDCRTLAEHRERIVPEPESCALSSDQLTPEERHLFETLRTDASAIRLEQERLSADWVLAGLDRWIADSPSSEPARSLCRSDVCKSDVCKSENS